MINFLEKCIDKPVASVFVLLALALLIWVISKSIPSLICDICEGIKELVGEFIKPITMVHKINLVALVLSFILALISCTPSIWDQAFPSETVNSESSCLAIMFACAFIACLIGSPTFIVVMKREQRLSKLASKNF